MDIRLPQLAEGADTGTIVALMVKEGEKIEKDQTLLELENQKAVAPIPSPVGGTVTKVHVKEGDEVTVGQVLISLDAVGAPVEPAPPTKSTPSKRGAAPTGDYQYESASGAAVPASPSIRKMARELGVDLTKIQGTEHGGRLTREDIREYLSSLQSGKGSAKGVVLPEAKQIDFSKWGRVMRRPFTPLRQTVSKAMTESWNRIPHVTQFDEVDVTDLLALKKKHGADYEAKQAPLTMTSFMLLAAAKALHEHPIFNSSLDETSNELVLKEYIHVGIAVDTPDGLIVPVLRDVNKKNLEVISKELASLAERTRSRKLALEEMQGASFTVSNQGGIGGLHFTPLIHWPEVAIIGIGRAVLRPMVVDKKVEPRRMLPVTLSYDHRVIDGADSARFMTTLKESLENFSGIEAQL